MHNFDLIFKNNGSDSKRQKLKISSKLGKKYIVCNINYSEFGDLVICQVANFVKSLSVALKGFPLLFNFTKPIKIRDKLSYVIFECICFYLIECGYRVCIHLNCQHDIRTCGIELAPLNWLRSGSCVKFSENFVNQLYGPHFCKLINNTTKKNPAFLSLLYNDIDLFLKNAGINDSRRDELSQTISELIGNACEHTLADCYVDIDIADDFYKVNDDYDIDSSTQYYGVNIVILNFSDNLLNMDLKNKVRVNIPNIDRYKKLREAYKYHEQHFDDSYTEDDFFNIAVFQNKISGSSKKDEVGGTGLTYLINSLQEKSDSDNCYVLSGNNVVYFLKEYLSYRDDWIGFNQSNDFFNDIPDSKVISRSHMFFSGTAYNLNFVMKSEENI